MSPADLTFSRYAVFYTLPPGPLSRFCNSWLGWDIRAGATVSPPSIDGLPASVADITRAPRKYGVHGTIKAPFHLQPGTTPDQLLAAFSRFCAAQSPVYVDRLELACLGRFVALVPVGDTSDLSALAARAVQDLDRFRAPLSEPERSRRLGKSMRQEHRNNLELWGYPYVMDAFKFHITLSGKLPGQQAMQVQTVLRPLLDPLLPHPMHLESLSLCGQTPAGMFQEVSRLPLGHPIRKNE